AAGGGSSCAGRRCCQIQCCATTACDRVLPQPAIVNDQRHLSDQCPAGRQGAQLFRTDRVSAVSYRALTGRVRWTPKGKREPIANRPIAKPEIAEAEEEEEEAEEDGSQIVHL